MVRIGLQLCGTVLLCCLVGLSGCDWVETEPLVGQETEKECLFSWNERAQQVYDSVASEKSDAGRLQILNYARLLRDFDKDGIVENRGQNGGTLLAAAVLNRDKKVVDRLLSLEVLADVNAQNDLGQTPLIIAVNNNFSDLVKCLVEHGALVNICDKQGLSPLMYAVLNENCELTRFLLSQGADATCKNMEGKTAVQLSKTDALKDCFNSKEVK